MLSNASVMQSFGETNCGSVIPPAPIESWNVHCPRLLACATNALNVHPFDVGLGYGIGEERTRFAVRI